MDKVITTVLLIVISMVMSLLLFNAAYPATMQASDSITRMADSADERMRDQIELIHAAGELNQAGFWNDADGSNDFSQERRHGAHAGAGRSGCVLRPGRWLRPHPA
jgi:hypothetical protein